MKIIFLIKNKQKHTSLPLSESEYMIASKEFSSTAPVHLNGAAAVYDARFTRACVMHTGVS